MFNTKTIARLAAVQTVYQYSLTNYTENINDIASLMLKLHKQNELYEHLEIKTRGELVKPNTSYFWGLIEQITANLTQIDQIISQNLDNDKPIATIQPLLLAILRVAACEINFFLQVPRKVIINEFTNIASEMLSETETGFINFILDKITKIDSKDV